MDTPPPPAPPAGPHATVVGPPAAAGAVRRPRVAQRGGKRGPYKRQLTLKEKTEVIAKIDAGASKSATARALGLNESTIRTIYSQKDKILATVKAAGPDGASARKRTRPEARVRMEQLLETYVRRQETKAISLSRSTLKSVALKFHRACLERYPPAAEVERNFTASPGWIANFCSRYGVRHVTVTGERASADVAEAEKFPAYLE